MNAEALIGLSRLLEHSSDFFVALDHGFRVIYVGEATARYFGLEVREMVGRSFWELWPEASGTEMEVRYRTALVTGEAQHFEYHRSAQSWLEVHAWPSADGLAIFFREIGTRPRYQDALRKTEDRLVVLNRAASLLGSTLELAEVFRKLRLIISDMIPCDGVLVSNYTSEDGLIRCEYGWSDGRELDVSQLPAIQLQKSGSGMQSQVILSGRPMLFDDVAGHVREPGTTYVEIDHDGVAHELKGEPPSTKSALMVPIKLEGKVTGVVQVMTDHSGVYTDEHLDLLDEVVAQMAAAVRNARLYERLRYSERRYRTLTEATNDIVWTASADGQLVEPQPGWEAYTGQPFDLHRGYGYLGAIDDADRDGLAARWIAAFHGRYAIHEEVRLWCAPKGEYRRCLVRCVPVLEDGSEVREWVGTHTDVEDARRAEESIQRLNAELEQRVEERTSDLQRAIGELEGFTYSVSHDLRAPIRAISGTSAILQEDYGDRLPRDAVELLRRQDRAARKMGLLIDDLLQLSRIARQELHRSEFDLGELARAVTRELAADGHAQNIEFEVESGLIAFADPTLVRYLLANLLENACKFSPSGGVVRVGLVEREEGPAFFVSDQGVGFDMSYAGRLFKPFERLVSEQQFSGTGIGLANVHKIVERHGGRVWAESRLGEGATFFFTFSANHQ